MVHYADIWHDIFSEDGAIVHEAVAPYPFVMPVAVAVSVLLAGFLVWIVAPLAFKRWKQRKIIDEDDEDDESGDSALLRKPHQEAVRNKFIRMWSFHRTRNRLD